MNKLTAFIRRYRKHLRDCRTVRRLLREHDSDNLRNLYWYDMPLREAVSWRGILRVALWGWREGQLDEIAGNYGLISLYRADPPPLPADRSNPPVWNCRSLDSRPWFDERSTTRDALEANADAIVAEFNAIRAGIGDHPDNDSLTPRGRWTGMFLFGADGRNDTLAAQCPVTTRTVESLPLCTNFGFVMFSGAEPGTHIAPHCGSSNLRQRNHLGVDVPEPDACRIRVGTEWRHWQQSKTIAFDDAFEHEVMHEGDRDRVVLSVDVWHPGLSPSDIAVLSHDVFRSFGYARG